MPRQPYEGPAEEQDYRRMGEYMTAARKGTVKPTGWVPPDRRPGAAEGQVMSFIRGALGRPDPAAPKADRSPMNTVGGMTRLQDKAWHSLSETEQRGVNAGNVPSIEHYNEVYTALLMAQDEADDEAPDVIDQS